MIALEVKLNGELLATAGREDLSVLNVIVDALGVLGDKSIGTKTEKDSYLLHVSVGGLSSSNDGVAGEHVRWAEQKDININDEIHIKIINTDKVDVPIKLKPQKINPGDDKKRWEHARDFYLKHKDKYEQQSG